MDLKEIMSVSGQGGLFKFVSQARNGIIVESFSDSKRSFVSTSTKVSALEDIAIFTTEEEVPLKQIFKTIYSLEPDVKIPDPGSDANELSEFMEKVLPDYDRSRVYVSDMKKIVSWYITLKSYNLLDFKDEENQIKSDSASDAGLDSNTGSAPKPAAGAGIKDDSDTEK